MFSRVYRPELCQHKIMASIFDQYEKAASNPTFTHQKSSSGESELEDKSPIFIKRKINFLPRDKITHFRVSGDLVIIVMANNIALRINLRQPDHFEEIELKRQGQSLRLERLFADPYGQHILFSVTSKAADAAPELLYLARGSVKLRALNKFKGHEITAVGWNFLNQQKNSTGPILMGTSKGLLFEAEIGDGDGGMFKSGLDENAKQVFDIGKGANRPITGIEFFRITDTLRYFILVTTPSRLYQFVGNVNNVTERPLLQQIFKNYLSKEETYDSVEAISRHSQLELFFERDQLVPSVFGWLTESNLLIADFNLKSTDYVIYNKIKFKFTPEESPSSFVMTEFHVLLLFSDHIKVYSTINQQLVAEDYFDESEGKPISLARDPLKGTIWVFTSRNVYNFKVIKEDRNIWLVYLDKKQYDIARNYCYDNPLYLDKVIIRQAEDAFENGDYETSAFYYAQTSSLSFEEIALKFLSKSEVDCLRTFLELKLKNLSKDDKTQVTMVVIWIIELYLSHIGKLRKLGSKQCASVQDQFDKFLEEKMVIECIKQNKGTIYDLMASHGDTKNLIKFTLENQDFERVIRHQIYKENYLGALEVLKKTSVSRRDLYYQFAPTLMQFIPEKTVEVLISQGHNLNPAKLLPALLMCTEEEQIKQATKFLEYCVYVLNSPDLAIHNLLVSIFAKKNKTKLMHYLQGQGSDASSVHYDIHYALRLCREEKLTDACVQLSALLGHWEVAVDLALQTNIKLAKETANGVTHDPELTKKLWLKIAEHVIKGQKDLGREEIREAMTLLKECDLLKIEDILSFFPDFVTIDDFKDAICFSLQEYNQHIQDLKQEMTEVTQSADIIHQEIKAFKNRFTVIKSTDICNLCDIQLLLRPFYIFPCGHYFHSDCLTSIMLQILPESDKNQLLESQKVINQQLDSNNSGKDKNKNQIDNILASECYFCGNYMIDSIDLPFVDYSDYESVLKQWL